MLKLIVVMILVLAALLQICTAPKGRRVCNYFKIVVLKHLKRGASVKDIEYWFGISKKTISRWDKKYNVERGEIGYVPRSGGPNGRWTAEHSQIAIL